MKYAIEIKDLSKKYKEVLAVDNLNLNIKEKSLFALLGVNGAGKTTTIKMLSCLTKPSSGDALIMGKSIQAESNEVKKIINISPQETAIAPNLTVYENMLFIAGIYEVEDKINKVNNLICELKLDKVKNTSSSKLSGGYQRRLSIGMALVTDPNVLFLDEPTLGLDVLAKRELWELIKNLKNKMTIILTTHYMEEAEILSDEIGIMYEGKLIEVGTSSSMIKKTKSKNFEEAFVKIVGEKHE